MIFNPQNLVKKEGRFLFSTKVKAEANSIINKDILKEFWFGFSFRTSKLEISECEEMVFRIGEAEAIDAKGFMYTIRVTEKGVCIAANSTKGLIKGYMALLDRIKPICLEDEEVTLAIGCCEIKDKPLIQNQMAHFCVFPETELWELQKYIRLCAALKYSHIVLEFWGTLEYDFMKELSWSHAYKKEEIRPLIREANDLGIEIIPMFNHWGHAAGSRNKFGKHVVLDQNPKLQTLFNEDGWSWNIHNEKTREILKNVRRELIELCGEGSYFHIGCDEAYNCKITEDTVPVIAEYLREIADDLENEGRRAIIWGDMFVAFDGPITRESGYFTSCEDKEIEKLWMKALDKRLIIGDWQYWVKETPVETALLFKNNGFDVLLCPWDQGVEPTRNCAKTVKEHNLFGLMHTTWDTIYDNKTTYISRCALQCWEDSDERGDACRTAALLRKVFFANGDYRKAGWYIKELQQK